MPANRGKSPRPSAEAGAAAIECSSGRPVPGGLPLLLGCRCSRHTPRRLDSWAPGAAKYRPQILHLPKSARFSVRLEKRPLLPGSPLNLTPDVSFIFPPSCWACRGSLASRHVLRSGRLARCSVCTVRPLLNPLASVLPSLSPPLKRRGSCRRRPRAHVLPGDRRRPQGRQFDSDARGCHHSRGA